MISLQRRSSPGSTVCGAAGVSWIRFAAVASGVSPLKGSLPVTISYSTTPSA